MKRRASSADITEETKTKEPPHKKRKHKHEHKKEEDTDFVVPDGTESNEESDSEVNNTTSPLSIPLLSNKNNNKMKKPTQSI